MEDHERFGIRDLSLVSTIRDQMPAGDALIRSSKKQIVNERANTMPLLVVVDDSTPLTLDHSSHYSSAVDVSP